MFISIKKGDKIVNDLSPEDEYLLFKTIFQ